MAKVYFLHTMDIFKDTDKGEEGLVLLKDHQAEIASLQASNNELVKALENADEKMRLARQTAFESMFRDILWQGTEEIVATLSKLKSLSPIGIAAKGEL